MNNFGVIELASTKTTNAPGWAYVPDTGPLQSSTTTTTNNRKRARGCGGQGGGALSSADASARQEAKARKEIEVLDRDNPRDVQIAVPPKPGGRASQSQRKHTPNVRKILQSQKTFANHLDDYVALGGGSEVGGGGAAAANNVAATPSAAAAQAARAANPRKASTSGTPRRASTIKQEDVEMADADEADDNDGGSATDTPPRSTILTPYQRPPSKACQDPASHPSSPSSPSLSHNKNTNNDTNPLLTSPVPPLPTDPELLALLSAPPLSYLEVRALSSTAGSSSGQQRYPPRVFCEVCGYWGRVRCVKCGARTCALDCLEAHREECVTRYGL
ncbi:hypothetical protein F4810DRAFT_710446 [Camillea tinctor]|nr:hypothetical protein F4810DRAFT_710446 [Camillea tinctor]